MQWIFVCTPAHVYMCFLSSFSGRFHTNVWNFLQRIGFSFNKLALNPTEITTSHNLGQSVMIALDVWSTPDLRGPKWNKEDFQRLGHTAARCGKTTEINTAVKLWAARLCSRISKRKTHIRGSESQNSHRTTSPGPQEEPCCMAYGANCTNRNALLIIMCFECAAQ